MRIALEPVDGVDVTTLMDNSSDALLPDEGLVRRWGLAGTAGPLPVVPNGTGRWAARPSTSCAPSTASPRWSRCAPAAAPGGCSSTPASPRTGWSATSTGWRSRRTRFEAIVFSHGHFDHVMGLRRAGPAARPAATCRCCCTRTSGLRRRIVGPGGRVRAARRPSRAAIEGAGFTVIEDRQPSFLLDGMLLVTGEVDRTTDFETGMPPAHQACRDGDVGARPAGPRRPGGRGARAGQGAGRAHRLRALRDRQHRPARQAAHRGRPRLRRPRRVAPARRRGHPAHGAPRSPRRRRTSSCRRTAPPGRPSTRSRPGCPAPSAPTPSAAGSSSESRSPLRRRQAATAAGGSVTGATGLAAAVFAFCA